MFKYIFNSCLYLLLFISTAIANEVTLNFQDTDINDLIKIISQVTGRTFIVDPRVKGKITIFSDKAMNADQTYDAFLSILSVHGFTAIGAGDIVKIIPENQAKTQNSPVLSSTNNIAGDLLVTQVIQVKHISAARLIPILRPLIRQQGHLVAYGDNNSLIISDHASNVRRLLKIIQRIDKKSRDEEVEIIVLEHATASEIVRTFTSLEQKKHKNAKAKNNTPTIIADDRTNSVLISGDRTSRLRLRTLITHLDTPLEMAGDTQVIYLRYAQAKDLVNVLKGISDSLDNTKIVKAHEKTYDRVKTNIQADEATNSLVITAIPKIQKNLQEVVRKLDIRRAQVLVEAIIAEISTDVAKELGVQWLFYGSGNTPVGFSNFDNTGTRMLDIGSAAYQANQGGNINLPNVGAGGFLGLAQLGKQIFNFGALLNALTSDTNTNVLSTPSLLTLDNQEAEIVVGQNIPLVTGQYTNTGTVGGSIGNPFQTIQREDVGIKLKVKPQINEGNSVKLEIEQEVSSISRSSLATSGIITNKRTIKTTVIVENNSMVVLGGLIDEDLQQTTQKIPILGDIPILGYLFRSQSTKKVKRNLVVFLHPVIMRNSSDENILSHRKYSNMRIQQLEQQARGLALMSDSEIPVLPDLDSFLTILPGEQHLSIREIEPELYK
ncbi:MAG: type II secretion system secretin GspD [Thiomargarita sp.]|nr:type II secretion system secretin GspD [Thiomargarita sp.]